MLSTDEFAAWSKKAVLFLHNTSRCDDEKYPDLLRTMGFNGFPTVALVDARGRKVKFVGHVAQVAEMDQALQEAEAGLRTWRALKKEVAGSDDRNKKRELFYLELELGLVDAATARATAASLQLGWKDKAKVERQVINLEFIEILRSTPKEQMAAAGEKYLAMWRRDRVPTVDQDTTFWQGMFEAAGRKGDVELFEALLVDVKKRKAGDERLARYLPRLERQLEALKARKGKR